MKLFVWDFHGTLEKGNERGVIALSNEALKRRGYRERFGEEHIRQLYGRKWYEYFAHLLPHESPATHLALQEECIALHYERRDIVTSHIAPNDYAVEVLAAIGARHDQILISNTRPAHVAEFLDMVGLRRFFPEGNCFGADSHRPDAKVSKQDIADEYLADKHFEKIIAIGDSPQDMIAVPDVIHHLYAHPGVPFRDCSPTRRIRDLREILREL